MKKIILGGIAALAIAAIAIWNVNLGNSQKSELSNLALANVEALAGEGNWLCPNGCYSGSSGCFCYQWYENEKEAGTFF